jgi:hypothetical protein
VDDLRFHMEILDKKGTQTLQMTYSLQGPRHSLDEASNAPMTSAVVLALVLQIPAVDNLVELLASAIQVPTMDNLASNKLSLCAMTPAHV